MTFWCKFPEDYDIAETCRSYVIKKYIECKIVHLLLLPQLRSERAKILILGFCSSWILRSVQWQFLDIVFRKPIGPSSRIKTNGP